MAFHVFLFFLVRCLAWLWPLYWLHHKPPYSRLCWRMTQGVHYATMIKVYNASIRSRATRAQ